MITDYATLQDFIAKELIRQDLTAEIPTFIQTCEADMSRRLYHPDMEGYSLLPIVGDEAIMPADFRKLLNVQYGEDELKPVSRREFDGLEALTGTPEYYTLQGSQVILYPSPNSVGSLAIRYKRQVEALSDTNTTNWILEDHPDAYLYGSLVRGAIYTHDPDKAAIWGQMYERAIADINMDGLNRLQTTRVEMCSEGVV